MSFVERRIEALFFIVDAARLVRFCQRDDVMLQDPHHPNSTVIQNLYSGVQKQSMLLKYAKIAVLRKQTLKM